MVKQRIPSNNKHLIHVQPRRNTCVSITAAPGVDVGVDDGFDAGVDSAKDIPTTCLC